MMLTTKQVLAFFRFLVIAVANKGMALFQGFLVVWLMDMNAYGTYAAIVAMTITVATMGNAGIGMFISSSGGRHYADAMRMGSVLAAAGRVQNVLLIGCGVVIVVTLPIQCIALNLTSTNWLILVTALGAATMVTTVRSMLQQEVMKICLRLELVQYLDCVMSALRTGATLTLYACDELNAVSLIAANLVINLISLLIQRRFIRTLAQPGAPHAQVTDDRREAWQIVLPQLPNAIYSAFQGQIPFWLMSLFNSVKTIAEFTALGRLGLMFGFLFDVLSGYFVPRVGRCQDTQHLGRLIFVILSSFYLIEALILFIAYIFRHNLLWLLGPRYAHLDAQLLFILCSIAISSVSGSLHAINSSRAWLTHSWSFIVLTVSTQALSLLVLDVSTLDGLLWFGLLPHFPFILINVYFLLRGLARFKMTSLASGNIL